MVIMKQKLIMNFLKKEILYLRVSFIFKHKKEIFRKKFKLNR
jgi:hypothetical protein